MVIRNIPRLSAAIRDYPPLSAYETVPSDPRQPWLKTFVLSGSSSGIKVKFAHFQRESTRIKVKNLIPKKRDKTYCEATSPGSDFGAITMMVPLTAWYAP